MFISYKTFIILISVFSITHMKKQLNVENNPHDKSILISSDNPTHSIIWLHGLGDSSKGFLPFFSAPQSPAHEGARVKLLNAPYRKVTINGGYPSTSWYDILSLSVQAKNEDRFNLKEVK